MNVRDMDKVVHVITGLNDGGAEAVLTRLCYKSVSINHVVVSLMDEGKYGPIMQAMGVKVFCLNAEPGRLSLSKFWRLIYIIRTERPSVVQTWMYHGDLAGGLAAKVSGVKHVFWGVHHSVLEKGKAKSSTIAIAKINSFFSRLIPEKIVCCANKALEVHRGIGYSAKKLMVIPNGYDLSTFKRNDKAGLAIREELAISSDVFLIGKVSRYDPFKDHDNLLAALSELKLYEIDFKCLLVGRGLTSQNEELTARINNLGLTDEILLAGQRTDIPAVMNALDLHVLSSTSEGFPNVLAEAMACGTPAVSTDVGDAGEIVGDPGLLCPPRDPRALSELMLAMHAEWLEKPNNWAERRTKCVEHIRSNFSIERMVAAYEQCWFGD